VILILFSYVKIPYQFHTNLHQFTLVIVSLTDYYLKYILGGGGEGGGGGGGGEGWGRTTLSILFPPRNNDQHPLPDAPPRPDRPVPVKSHDEYSIMQNPLFWLSISCLVVAIVTTVAIVVVIIVCRSARRGSHISTTPLLLSTQSSRTSSESSSSSTDGKRGRLL